MAKIIFYKDIGIQVVRATENPQALARLACDMTMRHKPAPDDPKPLSKTLTKFLVTAEHTSTLEHCSMTLFISGISRSLLAQLSRHRMASLTSQSQHYQTYSDMPIVIDEGLDNEFKNLCAEAADKATQAYITLLNEKVPKEEARQVLPTAASVNILWTVNARGLISFLRPRLCWRNVKEMKVFADKIHVVALEWWPELFEHIGPPCLLDECNQGLMRPEVCGNGRLYIGDYYANRKSS